MSISSDRRPAAVSWLYLAICVVLVSLNLRTLFSSFSAILPEIVAATGLPGWGATLLTTIPATLLGVFAPLAPILARRFGTWQVLFGALVLLTLGLVVRSLPGPDGGAMVPLLAGTVVSGVAIALSNVVLPSIVKQDFAEHLGLMSGLYTTAICGSAALGAGLTFPVYQQLPNWHWALGIWAIPVAVAAALLVPIILRHRSAAQVSTSTTGRSPLTSPVAWHITLMMICQAMTSFTCFAWLAPMLRERGIDGGSAGVIVAVSIVLQMAGSLLGPVWAARLRSQSVLNAAAALLTAGGFVLALHGPLAGIWLWTGVLGIGQGALTALALTMIALRSSTAHMAIRVSGMMQGLGYGLGSSGTFITGQIFATTGSFGPAAWLFVASGLGAVIFGWLAGRNRTIER
ncbi:MFS transporter [Citricoccus sp. GCM10030269]|uniref:MFS transporter n=1 Tax=Citricoccus sp. GCM10030269 TaxID=3273388 RepID=UPI003621C13F